MSVAERTRQAVRADPALYDALRSGVVNYSAAARELDVEGDEESIATALRRFADELPDCERADRRVSVRLHRGVGLTDAAFAGVDLTATGEVTALEVTGDAGPEDLEVVLGRLRTESIDALAAGVAAEHLIVAVEKRTGAEALRVVERALEAT